MSFITCRRCGKTYISRYGHCCGHGDCLVNRIKEMSLNYVFSAKGPIQNSWLFGELNQQSTLSNSSFYNSNNESASANEKSDASAISRTSEANRNILQGSDAIFYRPCLMANLNPGFRFLSQNEVNAIPSLTQHFTLVRPLCLTPIRDYNQIYLGHINNSNKEPERPTNIQISEILKSKLKETERREKNQNENVCDKGNFFSTSKKTCDIPPDYETAVAGPSRPRHVGHICPVCRKEFSKPYLLKQHSVMHSKEKPFVCDICKKSYKRNLNLKRHMLSHKRIKSHKCGQCGKAFTLKEGLKRHMFTHTGEKPYKCKICNKAFSRSGSLLRHVLSHRRTKFVQ